MKKRSIILIVSAVVVISVLVVLMVRMQKQKTQADALAPGLAYLQERESKDPNEVRKVRKEIRQKKLDAQRDSLVEKLSNGTEDPFSLFHDYLVMGDSRSVGFWYYDFLDQNRIFADGGHTIKNMQEELDAAVELNPSMIFLCYGMNDIGIGYWDTPEEYAAEYVKTVLELRSRLPEATIVVSSILPVTEQAFAEGNTYSSMWRDIPEWSAVLKEQCEKNQILFAECDDVFEQHSDLWDPVDGTHFQQALYPYWASHLIVTALMQEDAE